MRWDRARLSALKGPRWSAVCLIVGFLLAPPAAVPQSASRSFLAAGNLVEKATSLSDPSQHFAAYVPSSYDPARRWPVIFLMDPRGRALVPLERFRAAAEQHGYILISSYDTRSDVDFDPNTPALRAMVTDIDTLLSIDQKRLYLAGFSGTARSAWFYARFLGGSVAGIISFGAAGLTSNEPLPAVDDFAFFGAAGIEDFNYEELRALSGALQGTRIATRQAVFAGGHRWGPPEVCAEAVEWIELHAMRIGSVPVDGAVVGALYARWLERAATARTDFGPLESYFAYRDTAIGFAGLLDTTEATSRAAALADSPEVRSELRKADELSAAHRDYLARLREILDSVHVRRRPLDPESLLVELDVAALLQVAATVPATADSLAARRKLEAAFIAASFYEPRGFLAQDRPAEALTMLGIANAIKPDDPRVLIAMAEVHSRTGFRQAALDALTRAGDSARLQVATLLEDPYFYEPRSGEPLISDLSTR